MEQETKSITTVLFKWLRNFLPNGLTWIGSLKKHITPMSLFPLTPDKLGPLICKRINRLTLFARAQKQGTHTVTHMQGRQVLIEDPPPHNSEQELFVFVEQFSLYKSVNATSVIMTLTKQEGLLTIQTQ